MIRLYFTSIHIPFSASTLSGWQCEKAAAYKNREDSLRCIAAAFLVNTVLFGGAPAPPPLFGKYKKPRYEGKPEFNLSHAGDYAVLATSPAPVGVDIEQIREEDILSLGKGFLTEPEYLLLEQAGDKCALFFDLWTRKESYLKMLGAGLQLNPKTVQVLPPPAGCHFFTPTFFEGYAASACSADSHCDESFRQLHPE